MLDLVISGLPYEYLAVDYSNVLGSVNLIYIGASFAAIHELRFGPKTQRPSISDLMGLVLWWRSAIC